MRASADVKKYLSAMGRKGGAAGKGSPARRTAAIKAITTRWAKVKAAPVNKSGRKTTTKAK